MLLEARREKTKDLIDKLKVSCKKNVVYASRCAVNNKA